MTDALTNRPIPSPPTEPPEADERRYDDRDDYEYDTSRFRAMADLEREVESLERKLTRIREICRHWEREGADLGYIPSGATKRHMAMARIEEVCK